MIDYYVINKSPCPSYLLDIKSLVETAKFITPNFYSNSKLKTPKTLLFNHVAKMIPFAFFPQTLFGILCGLVSSAGLSSSRHKRLPPYPLVVRNEDINVTIFDSIETLIVYLIIVCKMGYISHAKRGIREPIIFTLSSALQSYCGLKLNHYHNDIPMLYDILLRFIFIIISGILFLIINFNFFPIDKIIIRLLISTKEKLHYDHLYKI